MKQKKKGKTNQGQEKAISKSMDITKLYMPTNTYLLSICYAKYTSIMTLFMRQKIPNPARVISSLYTLQQSF